MSRLPTFCCLTAACLMLFACGARVTTPSPQALALVRSDIRAQRVPDRPPAQTPFPPLVKNNDYFRFDRSRATFTSTITEPDGSRHDYIFTRITYTAAGAVQFGPDRLQPNDQRVALLLGDSTWVIPSAAEIYPFSGGTALARLHPDDATLMRIDLSTGEGEDTEIRAMFYACATMPQLSNRIRSGNRDVRYMGLLVGQPNTTVAVLDGQGRVRQVITQVDRERVQTVELNSEQGRALRRNPNYLLFERPGNPPELVSTYNMQSPIIALGAGGWAVRHRDGDRLWYSIYNHQGEVTVDQRSIAPQYAPQTPSAPSTIPVRTRAPTGLPVTPAASLLRRAVSAATVTSTGPSSSRLSTARQLPSSRSKRPRLMSDLWSSIAILAKALGSDWAMALADRMDATDQPTDLPRRVREIGASGYSSIAAETSMRWSSTDSYSAKEVAAALRGAASMLSHLNASESIDIVWTGPESPFVATRRTEQVLQQIIRSAKKTLTLISFIFVNPGGLADDLRAASDRGVKIIGIFEPPAHRGGGRKDLTIDSVVNLQAIVPRAECYEWPQDLKIAHGAPSTSVIHAKAAIADETQAFVTSANLTGAAMETNMELGIRMVGSTAASRLQKLITSLIETGCVRRFTI